MNMTADEPNIPVATDDEAVPSARRVSHYERRTALSGILTLRCPECRLGKVFGNLLLKMNSACPVCGLKFEREPGYFLGAMYFSYGMAIPPLTIMTLVQKWLQPERSMASCIIVATLVFLPLVVPIVRYSRVMWLYFDRFFDPQDRQPPVSNTN